MNWHNVTFPADSLLSWLIGVWNLNVGCSPPCWCVCFIAFQIQSLAVLAVNLKAQELCLRSTSCRYNCILHDRILRRKGLNCIISVKSLFWLSLERSPIFILLVYILTFLYLFRIIGSQLWMPTRTWTSIEVKVVRKLGEIVSSCKFCIFSSEKDSLYKLMNLMASAAI